MSARPATGARSRRPSPAAVAIAVAVVAAVAVLLALLLDKEPRRISSNNRGIGAAAQLAPRGGRLCEYNEPAPAGAGTIGLYTESEGKTVGPLDVTLLDSRGHELAAGTLEAGVRDAVAAPVQLDRRLPAGNHTVCIVNRGDTVALLRGDPAGTASGARVTGMPQFRPVRLKLEWMTLRQHSAFDFAPTVARRFGFVKASFFGSWTMWAALGLLLSSCALAVLAVARAVRE